MSTWKPLKPSAGSVANHRRPASVSSNQDATPKKNGKENFLTPQARRPASRFPTKRSDSVRSARKSESTSNHAAKSSGHIRTPVGSTTPRGSRRDPQDATPECFTKVEFETPRIRSHRPSFSSVSGTPSRFEDNSLDEDGFSVTVAVRVRPFSEKWVIVCGWLDRILYSDCDKEQGLNLPDESWSYSSDQYCDLITIPCSSLLRSVTAQAYKQDARSWVLKPISRMWDLSCKKQRGQMRKF